MKLMRFTVYTCFLTCLGLGIHINNSLAQIPEEGSAGNEMLKRGRQQGSRVRTNPGMRQAECSWEKPAYNNSQSSGYMADSCDPQKNYYVGIAICMQSGKITKHLTACEWSESKAPEVMDCLSKNKINQTLTKSEAGSVVKKSHDLSKNPLTGAH